MHNRSGFQRRANTLFTAFYFQRASDDGADLADLLPLRFKRIVFPFRRNFRELDEMHRFRIRITRQPRFFRREGQHWREPRDQAIEQLGDDGQGRAALQRRRRVAIKRVLADIEIEGGKLDIGKVDQRAGDLLEFETVVTFANDAIQFGQAMQHQLFQFRQIVISDLLALIMGKGAEHPADGVAQLAIGIDICLDDGLAEALVFPVVCCHDPQAQDIGARVLHDFLRRDDVALGLRHLLALLIHGETMGDNGVIGRTAARRTTYDERRLKPAAMLIGAFQIDIRRPFEIRAVFQCEGMRTAAVEPHVENVHDLLPFGMVVVIAEEAFLGAFSKPGISAFSLKGLHNPLIDGIVEQNLALLVRENRYWDAPRSLPRKNPVGFAFDHGAQTILTGGRHETCRLDCTERPRA